METLGIWNKYMANYDFLNEVDSYAENLNDIANAAGAKPGMRILDAGSGTGNLSMLLKAKGSRVLSCDFSPAALARHKQKDPEAECLELSLESPLPLDNASFDVVCCASVLFTLSQQGCQVAVSEFFRVLKPGGRLIVTTVAPNQRNGNLVGMHLEGLRQRYGRTIALYRGIRDLPRLMKVLYYSRQLAKMGDWNGFHRFEQTELKSLLKTAGFEIREVRSTYGGCFFLAIGSKS